MVVTNAEHGIPALVFTTILVLCLASFVLRAQGCMPMMPMMSVSSMVQQTANGFLYQASTQFFTPFVTYVLEPLMKLILFGPTSLVSHVLFEMTPIPFSSQNITRRTLEILNIFVGWSNVIVFFIEAFFRQFMEVLRINVWTFLNSKLRLVYNLRLLLAENLTASYLISQANGLAYEAIDDQVALRVWDMSNHQEEAREGRSREGAAQDCVRELVCGLWASRATTHLWQAFWTMIPLDEEPPSLPQFCGEENEEFSSCYVFVDDVVQTWQAQLDYYLNQYNNISSKGFSYQNKSIIWAVYG